jgi:transposase
MAILYRLKTGCQWRELSMKQFLRENTNGKVFIRPHFQNWNKNGSWEKV